MNIIIRWITIVVAITAKPVTAIAAFDCAKGDYINVGTVDELSIIATKGRNFTFGSVNLETKSSVILALNEILNTKVVNLQIFHQKYKGIYWVENAANIFHVTCIAQEVTAKQPTRGCFKDTKITTNDNRHLFWNQNTQVLMTTSQQVDCSTQHQNRGQMAWGLLTKIENKKLASYASEAIGDALFNNHHLHNAERLFSEKSAFQLEDLRSYGTHIYLLAKLNLFLKNYSAEISVALVTAQIVIAIVILAVGIKRKIPPIKIASLILSIVKSYCDFKAHARTALLQQRADELKTQSKMNLTSYPAIQTIKDGSPLDNIIATMFESISLILSRVENLEDHTGLRTATPTPSPSPPPTPPPPPPPSPLRLTRKGSNRDKNLPGSSKRQTRF